ncbi:hypothetical protein [Sphingomonas sp. 3P27F8]|nr:hypothetical protein [Sphingomonas sp. 3P27F8]
MIDDSSCDRVQHHTMYPEDLAHMLQMFLVAAQAINVLDNNDVRLTG